MMLTLKSTVTPNGKVVSLVDKTRTYFQTLDSDNQGVKVAKTWAKNNGFLVLPTKGN